MAESVQPLVQPIRESVIGALRNALQIAQLLEEHHADRDSRDAFRDIARLVRHAIEGLSEPNAAAIQTADVWVRDGWTDSMRAREARDIAATILSAQLTGTL